MAAAVTIPSRFNGPLQSGNGGYSCGVFAAEVEGPAAVSLRSPVPLDRPLAVERGDGAVRFSAGETLVAEARPAERVALAVPAPVAVEAAREASSHYASPSTGIFSRCFVCGPGREDSMHVFAAAVAGREEEGVIATPWTPPPWGADAAGATAPELVWAALDCPAYFAAYPEGGVLSFLARQNVDLRAPVAAGVEHVVIAWPTGGEGRKRGAGAAVLSAAGAVLALGEALMVEPREQVQAPADG